MSTGRETARMLGQVVFVFIMLQTVNCTVLLHRFIRNMESRLEQVETDNVNLTKQICDLERRMGVLMEATYQRGHENRVSRVSPTIPNIPPAPATYDEEKIRSQFEKVHAKLSSFEGDFRGLHDNIANIVRAQHEFREEQSMLRQMIQEVHARPAIPQEVNNRLTMLDEMIRRMMQAFRQQPRRAGQVNLNP